jgi:phosphohistidine phosphatase
MKLYLVQHGEAKPKAQDPERPLTAQGQDDVERVAAFARRAGVEIHQIRHSGTRRAEETATILGKHLEPADGVVAIEGLAPTGDVRRVAEFLGRETRPFMFVGHRPFMDRLAGLLVAGDKECAAVRFAQGGIVCLERDPETRAWVVRWVVTPDLIP